MDWIGNNFFIVILFAWDGEMDDMSYFHQHIQNGFGHEGMTKFVFSRIGS